MSTTPEQSRTPTPADMPRRRFDAPSPFDEQPTLPFDEIPGNSAPLTADNPFVEATGSPFVETAGAPAESVEAVYAAIDPDVLEDGGEAAAKLLADSTQKLPDISADMAATMAQLYRDKKDRTSGFVEPEIHEEYLYNLGRAELARSQAAHRLQTVDADAAARPASKVDDVVAFIDAALPSVADDQKAAFEADKRAVARLRDSAAAEQAAQARQTAAGRYYAVATELKGRAISDTEKDRLLSARDVVEDLTKRDAAEAKALEVLSAYVPNLDKLPAADTASETAPADSEEIIEARTRVEDLERQLGLLYAKREYKTKKGIGQPKLRGKDAEILDEYNAASNELFKLEHADLLADPNVADEQKILAIAEYTIKRGRALEDAKDAQDGRSWFRKKIIHGLGKAVKNHPYWTAVLGVAAGGLTSLVTAGAGAGATAGLITYAKMDYWQHEKRAGKPKIIKDDQETLDILREDIRDEVDSGRLDGNSVDDMLRYGLDDNERVFARRAGKEQLRRLGSVAAGAAAFGAGFAAAHWLNFDSLSGHDSVQAMPAPDTPTPDMPTPDTPAPTPDVPVPGHDFAPGTFYAHNGDGFYDILQNMGVEASQRDDVLARASGELFRQGYAYHMPDGLPGIPRPGSLPQGAIDILVKAAGR